MTWYFDSLVGASGHTRLNGSNFTILVNLEPLTSRYIVKHITGPHTLVHYTTQYIMGFMTLPGDF